jgi:hypothetical protein
MPHGSKVTAATVHPDTDSLVQINKRPGEVSLRFAQQQSTAQLTLMRLPTRNGRPSAKKSNC